MSSKRGKSPFFTDEEFQIGGQERKNTQEVQEAQEAQEAQKAGTSGIKFGSTQGKKGQKAPRINMAFSPENHVWIKTRSRQLGVSATEFVNEILDRERTK